jgi:hypothetical protein
VISALLAGESSSNISISRLTGIRRLPHTQGLSFRLNQRSVRVLNNEDLAEMLETTRDRIAHMGGGTSSALGVANVLEALIAMLREQSPTAYGSSSIAQKSDAGSEDQAEPEPADATAEPRRRVPVRFRGPETQTPSPEPKDNPLLRPQYADFFNKLIASHKTEQPPAEHSADEPPQPAEAPVAAEPARHRAAQSTVKPQYQDFFDKLVGKQKETAVERPAQDEVPAAQHAQPTAGTTDEPPRAVGGFRDETATGG